MDVFCSPVTQDAACLRYSSRPASRPVGHFVRLIIAPDDFVAGMTCLFRTTVRFRRNDEYVGSDPCYLFV